MMLWNRECKRLAPVSLIKGWRHADNQVLFAFSPTSALDRASEKFKVNAIYAKLLFTYKERLIQLTNNIICSAGAHAERVMSLNLVLSHNRENYNKNKITVMSVSERFDRDAPSREQAVK
jgi:hypothetical protein